MDISITTVTKDDAEALIEFTKKAGGETDNLTFGSDGIKITIEEECTFLESFQNSSRKVFYVAKKDGQIIGNASFRSCSNERMSHRGEFGIAVLKSEWGQGVGSMLLEKIIKFAKETAKVDIISLEVRSDNERAIRLYKKFGFQKIGTFEGFFKIDGKYIDFDLMELFL